MSKDTDTLSFLAKASAWGQAYEILIKRGVLALLRDKGLFTSDHIGLHPHMEGWAKLELMHVRRCLCSVLQITDDGTEDIFNNAFDYLNCTAFGTGYTATREYIRSVEQDAAKRSHALTVDAIWCPLNLPTASDARPDRSVVADAFGRSMRLNGFQDPAWADRGRAANSDFILVLNSHRHGAPAETSDQRFVLVQEYSYNMPARDVDYRDQAAHLAQMCEYQSRIDSRCVFTQVTAEVDGEGFAVAGDIKQFLYAFTSQDKPLYKLTQSCAYLVHLCDLLRTRREEVEEVCNQQSRMTYRCRAQAITSSGIESLAAVLSEKEEDPRMALMQTLGNAYVENQIVPQGSDLSDLIERAKDRILSSLPQELRNEMKLRLHFASAGEAAAAGKDVELFIPDQVTDFYTPAEALDSAVVDDLLQGCQRDDAVRAFFDGDAEKALRVELETILRSKFEAGKACDANLRDLHASAVVAGMKRAQPGKINVLALEGNPGIGKTTAIRSYLTDKDRQGFIFLYLSPRVVINRNVTADMGYSGESKEPSGVLTVTTNSAIIASGQEWCRKNRPQFRVTDKTPVVVVGGVPNLNLDSNAIIYLTPEEEMDAETQHASAMQRKKTLSESKDRMRSIMRAGVLSSMTSATRELLAANPGINRAVMTAAIQGFRSKSGSKTTIDGLNCLFERPYKASEPRVRREREALAKRTPNIVVMVDEVTGDGAGAPFIHEIAKWLHTQFLKPFLDDGITSPFTVSLVIADASLVNEAVLARYVSGSVEKDSPDKILLCRSRGASPFYLAANSVKIGGREYRALHVMTNSFPARKDPGLDPSVSALEMVYKIDLYSAEIGVSSKSANFGQEQTPHEAIRSKSDDLIGQACKAIAWVLKQTSPPARQVIYFAQDKAMLGEIRNILTSQESGSEFKKLRLSKDDVLILDSSVPATERERITKPEVRDAAKVFLMTSSGARGVSFPKTNYIITTVPRFAIESSLMEISQLVYRGRGSYRDIDPCTGRTTSINGDDQPRRLIFLLHDYLLVHKPPEDARQMMDYRDDLNRRRMRQLLDLTTTLMLLRSTIMTRIKGDAGIRNKKLALVPVGGTGTEDMARLMASSVGDFVRQANVALRRESDDQQKGLLINALDGVDRCFGNYHVGGKELKSDSRSFACFPGAPESYANDYLHIVQMNPLATASNELAPTIPDHVYILGPMAIEKWADQDMIVEEVYRFEGDASEHDRHLLREKLKRQLGMIRENGKEGAMVEGRKTLYARDLRKAAEALYRILARGEAGTAKRLGHGTEPQFMAVAGVDPDVGFAVESSMGASKLWYVTPVTHAMFRNQGQSSYMTASAGDLERWHSVLMRSLGARTVAEGAPALARYTSNPYAVRIAAEDPTRFDIVFDDRYFGASSEFNLLNALLL